MCCSFLNALLALFEVILISGIPRAPELSEQVVSSDCQHSETTHADRGIGLDFPPKLAGGDF
jgi:hypothetical protein